MGNNLEFAGKVALVTGGNSGIGAAAARRVAELGAQVVVTGRRQSEGRLLVSNIKRNSGSAAFIQADLSQPEQVKRIVPFTLKTFGRLDYAFNNAGISGENRLLTDQTEKTFDRVFAVNVKALFLLLQDEVKQMMAQGQGGSIVNERVTLFATLENSVFLTPKIRSCARENLLRSSALSLASRVLAACERFQLPRSSLKRSQRMRALCQQPVGPASREAFDFCI